MSVRSLPPLSDFQALIEAMDSDASYRLSLVRRATPVLYEGISASREQAETLADRFERWRYQILNKRGNHLSPGTRDLVDVLDLASCRIKGCHRPPRRPRRRAAVQGRRPG